MKLIVNKVALYDALQIAAKAIGKNVIPALENFLFTVQGQTLTVSGSNLEVWISTTVQLAEPTDAISIMVPSARITGLLKELPDQDLQFTIEEKTTEDGKRTFYNTTIKAGKGKFTIPCEPGENFPSMNCDEIIKVQVTTEQMLTGIEKTLFAADKSGNDARLAGVCVTFQPGGITFASCDHWVLSTCTYQPDNWIHENEQVEVKSITIPTKALSVLQSLAIAEDRLTLSLNERNVAFDLGNDTILKSVLIDEKYPDFKAIIPISNDKVVTVDRCDFIGVLKRASQFADLGTHSIMLNISGKKLTVNSRNHYEEEATEDLPCKLTGEPIDIWVKCSQVLSILTRMDGDTVYMHLSAPNRAIVFKSDANAPDDKTNLMLAMPVMGV